MIRAFILLLSVGLTSCTDSGADANDAGAVGAGSTSEAAADAGSERNGGRFQFSDVTQSAGLSDFRHVTGAFGEKWMPETMGSGGGFIDYDGDGWVDVLLVSGGQWPHQPDSAEVPVVRLYRNLGDGTFSKDHDAIPDLSLDEYGFGITVADYDNDGDDDFYLTTLRTNKLFRNDGGSFTDIASDAGVAGSEEWSTCSIFFDADRDGHLDLYVCSYVDWSPEAEVPCFFGGKATYCPPERFSGFPGRYFHNDGNGTFTERTAEAGFIEMGGKSLGVVEMDANRDGWPDLLVANDGVRNFYYENDGDGTFTEKAVMSGVAYDDKGRPRGGMGIDAGDVDNDGRTTAFIANFSEQMVAVFRSTDGSLFEDRAGISQVGPATYLTLAFGLFLADLDLDGFQELFVANGHIQEFIEEDIQNVTYRQRPQLFSAKGDGTFENVGESIGGVFDEPLVARGAAYADYDRDGDLDILVTENGGPVRLWRNDVSGRNALHVKLTGRASNRGGIGSEVTATVGSRSMRRRVQTGGSYLSASEQVASFGLASGERVDSLIVRWPSGAVDRFTGIEANRFLCIVEGSLAVEECELGESEL